MPDPLSAREKDAYSSCMGPDEGDAIRLSVHELGMTLEEYMRRQIAKRLGLSYADYENKRQFALRHADGNL